MIRVELKEMNSPEYGAPRKVSKIHFEVYDFGKVKYETFLSQQIQTNHLKWIKGCCNSKYTTFKVR